MKITLTVSVEGGDDAIAQLKDFVATARSGETVGHRTVPRGDNDVGVAWSKEQGQEFTLLAFNQPSFEEQGDALLATMINDELKDDAMIAWPYGGAITCKHMSALRKKYGYTTWEGMLAKHTGLSRDFFDAKITVNSDVSVSYRMHTYTNDFLLPFTKLSKRYPMLTFGFLFKRATWEPGDRFEKFIQHEHEIWNGKTVHKDCYAKPITNPSHLNRSWGDGSPRRNIWNVVRSQINEHGQLNQPLGEFPNGRMETGEIVHRPSRNNSFSALMRRMEQQFQGEETEEPGPLTY